MSKITIYSALFMGTLCQVAFAHSPDAYLPYVISVLSGLGLLAVAGVLQFFHRYLPAKVLAIFAAFLISAPFLIGAAYVAWIFLSERLRDRN